jgi:predicted transcriptional regulator
MMRHPDKYKLEYFPVDGQQLREMREKLLTDCLETQCELEYQLYKHKKQWADDSDIAHFINSSRERQQIFWAFNRKGYENGWTVSMMAEYLDRDVSATSKDLSLMQQKKYIYRNKSEGYQRYYLPSERVINNGKYFVEHYVDLTTSLTESPERLAFFQYRAAERQAFKKVVDPTS